MPDRRSFWLLLLWGILLILAPVNAHAAPKAKLWDVWVVHDPQSKINVDHAPWDQFLKKYVQPASRENDSINRLNYKAVDAHDQQILTNYIDNLASVPVFKLNRDSQMVYWINLYNALTVRVVLEAYPVESILDIDISPGLFSNGPWGKKIITIEGEKVSLDDIEHRILRPIWQEPRLHYVLNCAALGCPQIGVAAITSQNANHFLEQAAQQFINHPRSVRQKSGKVYMSSIFDWYQDDFGGNETKLLNYIRQYIQIPAKAKIADFDYDWRLNDLD